jgi:CBS domain containing-hemolysin-like protein
MNLIETLWMGFIILILVDLVFAAVRVSVLNARLPYLIAMREQHPQAVDRMIVLAGKPRLRTSLRLGALAVHFMLAGVVCWIFILMIGSVPGFGAALLLLVVFALLLLVVEFLVEGAILPQAEEWALRLSGLAQVIDSLLSPLSTLLTMLLGPPALLEKRLSPVTEDVLKSWAEEEQPEGTLEQGERQMIYSIFHFGDTLAREIMIPRIDIFALEANTPLNDAILALNNSGHSRVPIFEETIDNVIGLLYAKDLLRVYLEGQKVTSLRSLLRPAYFVPEAKKVDELLREMQSRSVHMALVVDEYGGIAGLVTLEDIVEEIVGEIRDEYDQGEEQLFEKIGDDEYIFHGRIDLDDFNSVMGTHLPKNVADTLGGFIYSQIGRVPAGGETIDVEDLALTVEQVSGRRIRRVRALRRSTIPAAEERTNGNQTEG